MVLSITAKFKLLSSMNIFVLLLIISTIAFWLITKKAKYNATTRKKSAPSKKPMAYRAVSIKPCANSCQQYEQFKNKRFLIREVPLLPLPGCDKKCSCSFEQYNDRRDGDDRRYPLNSIQSTLIEQDHRAKRSGRRKTDL